MEVVFGLVSLTVAKLLHFSGLLDNRNVVRSRKMEEKALEVYGEDVSSRLENDSGVTRITVTVKTSVTCHANAKRTRPLLRQTLLKIQV